jgi:hypothetical protein
MDIPQKYLHDKAVLALVSANAFLTILVIITVLLRLSGNTAEGFIVQYRENLGLNAFQAGNAFDMLTFILFALIVMAVSTGLSLRVYELKRQLAMTVLGLCSLLLILTLIVSNALLVLQ